MVVECQNCHAKYNVNEDKIPDAGVRVKCHKCQHVIEISKPTSQPAPTEAISPPMPEVPSPPVPGVPDQPEPESPPEEPSHTPEPPAAQEEEAVSSSVPPEQPSVEAPSEAAAFPDAPSEATLPPAPAEQPEPPAVEAPPEEESVSTVPEETAGVSSPPEEPSQALEIETTQYPSPVAETPPTTAVPELPAGMSEDEKKLHQRARRLAKALASDLVLYNQDKVEQGLREGTLAQLLGSEIRRSWEYYCQQIPKNIVDSTDYFKEQLNKIVGKGKEIFK